MKKPSLLRSLASFSSMTMVSRVFGLLRDMAINAAFGADWRTDAFWVAFRIPNFMRRLFAEGSFSTAFVPVLTEVKETRSLADVRELVSRTAGTLGAVLLLIVAIGVIFAPQVTLLFSPGAVQQPEKLTLTVELLRLTFPFLLFVSLTALAGGVLNSYHRFGLPALTPAVGAAYDYSNSFDFTQTPLRGASMVHQHVSAATKRQVARYNRLHPDEDDPT